MKLTNEIEPIRSRPEIQEVLKALQQALFEIQATQDDGATQSEVADAVVKETYLIYSDESASDAPLSVMSAIVVFFYHWPVINESRTIDQRCCTWDINLYWFR